MSEVQASEQALPCMGRFCLQPNGELMKNEASFWTVESWPRRQKIAGGGVGRGGGIITTKTFFKKTHNTHTHTRTLRSPGAQKLQGTKETSKWLSVLLCIVVTGISIGAIYHFFLKHLFFFSLFFFLKKF